MSEKQTEEKTIIRKNNYCKECIHQDGTNLRRCSLCKIGEMKQQL